MPTAIARRSARTSMSAPVNYQEDKADISELAPPVKRAKIAVKSPQRPKLAKTEIKDEDGSVDPIAKQVAAEIVSEVEAKQEESSGLSSAEDADVEDTKPKKRKKAAKKEPKVEPPTHFETRVNVHGEEYSIELDEEGDPVKRDKNGRRLAKRKKKDVVHIIPDVPKRDFRLEGPSEKREERKDGFRGQLGYACLNTVLRWQDPPVFSSRTARIKTMDEQGPDFIKELGRLNCRDMIPMILWNEENGIKFMRLSSEVFPFASHEKYGYSLEYAEKELKAAGDLAKRLGHRLTMHPGQFTQLGSNRPEVIESSIRDLSSHCEMLDRMGLSKDSVMIIHGGGTFGDRAATLDRMRETYTTRLTQNIKDRLVLENDEMSWSAEELLPLYKELDIPMVFDFHHDLLRPSARPPSELLPEIQAIWAKKGMTPKYHLSEPRPGSTNLRERRAHSDRCGVLPPDLPADAYLMIEAKDKEQAVLELHRIYDIRPVKQESLRAPAKDIGVKTSGRKSKLGGERLPRAGKKSKAAPEDGDDEVEESFAAGEDEDDFNPDTKASPVKLNAKSLSKAERAIAKAKEAAKRLGKKYTGPGADLGDEEGIELAAPAEEEYIKSSLEVLQDMHMEADWVRQELQAGRERRPFGTEPGAVDEEGDDAEVDEDGNSVSSVKDTTPKKKSKPAKKVSGAAKARQDGIMTDNGSQVVLAQGAPLEELTADHENIPLPEQPNGKKGKSAKKASKQASKQKTS